MRRLVLPLALLAAAIPATSQSAAAPARQPAGVTPERHEFVIHNFKTESGIVLPEAHIVYGTYGILNADLIECHPASIALHGQPHRLWLPD